MRRMMPRIECLPSSIAYSENLIGNDCTFTGIVSTAYSTFVCKSLRLRTTFCLLLS